MAYLHEAWRAVFVNGILGWAIIPPRVRWRVLRSLGMEIYHATVSDHVWFGTARKVAIGRGSFINRECMFSTHAPIRIGEQVDVGMRVMFITGTHEIGPAMRRAGTFTAAPIHVGDGAWIGAGAVILPGVRIGAGTIIAAGAIVTSDCEPDGVYAGVPAYRVRDL